MRVGGVDRWFGVVPVLGRGEARFRAGSVVGAGRSLGASGPVRRVSLTGLGVLGPC